LSTWEDLSGFPEIFDELYEKLQANYCFDESRLYAIGHGSATRYLTGTYNRHPELFHALVLQGAALNVEPPTIVSVAPLDGSVGVASDTSIVVRFSESMDTARVRDAFYSDDIDASNATYQWSDSGRVLTIVLSEPLQYAAGLDWQLDIGRDGRGRRDLRRGQRQRVRG
jgi:hypothetical protein